MTTTGPCPLGPRRQHTVTTWETPGETARLTALWEPESNQHRNMDMEPGESTDEKFIIRSSKLVSGQIYSILTRCLTLRQLLCQESKSSEQ